MNDLKDIRRIFAAAIDAEAAYSGGHRGRDSPSYQALLPFLRMVATERDSLREFVLSLPPPPREDWLAQQARRQAEHNRHHWSQLLVQVRTVGLRRIYDWDIRCVDRLIELFPGCVPKSWHRAALCCRVAEPSGQWLLCPRPVAPSSTRGTGLTRA
ncbi:hypothetical protein [Verminephrobacter eiseniae]|uniref:hypothetical protein n=1 Tax=Verminephrobacter eiseniae TaxID=364317 RepID=UPI00223832D0|nr:hypothetical protein [Verminephrobacter eiseniae]MCW5292664.1 hypothetical protein [Verminephrobacter eiseniae]